MPADRCAASGIAVAIYVLYHNVWPGPDWPFDLFPYLVAAWLGGGGVLAARSARGQSGETGV